MASDVLDAKDEGRKAPVPLIPVSIAKALIDIQKDLKPMAKSATNSAFASSYVPLEEVTMKAHELLSKRGIGVMQSPITDGQGHAALETTLFTGSGQSLTRTTKLAMNKVDPQSHGSAITYTRRYALMAMLGLTGEGEDDDANKATGVVVPVSEEQKSRIKSLSVALKYHPKQVEQQLLDVKTHDHAALAIVNLEKNISMRVRDDESKANAAEAEAEHARRIMVGTDEVESAGGEVDPISSAGFQQRLKALKLAGPTYEKKVIAAATKAPFLSKVMEKQDRIESLDNFLKALESGVHRLEAEFYAPSKENIVVDEKVA